MFFKKVVLVRTIRFIYLSEIASTINITDVVSLFPKCFFQNMKSHNFDSVRSSHLVLSKNIRKIKKSENQNRAENS